MDRNLLLAFALSFAVLVTWSMLTAPPPVPVGGELAPQLAEQPTPPALQPPQPGGSLPVLVPGVATTPAGPQITSPTTPSIESERIPVETALYRLEIDTRGAAVSHWELKEFDTGPKNGAQPIVLTTGIAPFDRALVTPFDELGIGNLGDAVFTLDHQDGSTYAFRYVRDGLVIRKTYVFRPDAYGFELRVSVENHGADRVAPRFAVNWPAGAAEGQDFREQALAVMHQGGVERTQLVQLGKGSFFGGSGEPVVNFVREVDWAGSETTYFVAALLPDSPAQASARFVATEPGRAGVVQVFFDPVELPPGQAAERVFRGYVGPKEPARLDAVGGDLVKSIDLGWSWVAPLTRAFGWLLAALYTFVPNYGLSIILLTIMVRLVTAPLTNKQMRSMERMRALSPKLQELKEQHADDRQKQSEEMMRLYRQEGVNPLGGCLPMVLQLPVFIGLFYALRSSIQLRQAPFVGWIDDLSAPEVLFSVPGFDFPIRLLPIVMAGTMFLQQKITPMQMDPAQAKMMMTVMPLMMLVFFYQFPSGLVLYWMVSNALAISHQLWIGRGVRAKAKAA